MGDDAYHEPVLVEEVLDYLDPSDDGLFFDGTVGGGGHARAVLEHCPGCRLMGCDRDPEALARARATLASFGSRAVLEQGRFDDVIRTRVGPAVLSGALLDLGVSSRQLDVDARGFAFRRGVALDMRMDGEDATTATAADVLNEAPEDELADIFRRYAEEPRARRLARIIARRRGERPFRTSDDLVAALSASRGTAPSQRDKARVFQALRIAVNQELEALERGLEGILPALMPGGRVVVISYHSLEDRMVKLTFRDWSAACVCPPELPVCACRGEPLGTTLTKKPVRPTEDEVAANPRARSARLRAWRKAA